MHLTVYNFGTILVCIISPGGDWKIIRIPQMLVIWHWIPVHKIPSECESSLVDFVGWNTCCVGQTRVYRAVSCLLFLPGSGRLTVKVKEWHKNKSEHEWTTNSLTHISMVKTQNLPLTSWSETLMKYASRSWTVAIVLPFLVKSECKVLLLACIPRVGWCAIVCFPIQLIFSFFLTPNCSMVIKAAVSEVHLAVWGSPGWLW